MKRKAKTDKRKAKFTSIMEGASCGEDDFVGFSDFSSLGSNCSGSVSDGTSFEASTSFWNETKKFCEKFS